MTPCRDLPMILMTGFGGMAHRDWMSGRRVVGDLERMAECVVIVVWSEDREKPW